MSNWFEKISPYISTVLEPVLGGVLHKYGAVAQTAVRSAVTKTDNGLEHLIAIYNKYDAAHPLVQTAVAEAQSLLKLTGLKVPNAEDLGSHIRAAIHDVASAFVTLDGTTAADTTVATSSGTTAAPAASTAQATPAGSTQA